MKFRVDATQLNNALDTVTLVPPAAVTSQGGSGYLFVVKDGVCSIHSRDEFRQIRVEIPVVGEAEDGSCIYPSDKISSMKYLDGWIDFESGQDGSQFWVKYSSQGGAKAERSTCNPSLMQTVDEDLAKAGDGFTVSPVLLREGISVTKGYTIKVSDTRLEDQYKTVQLFDAAKKKEWAKGDGCLFATDHVRMIYFYCDALKGKGIAVHGRNFQCVLSFLSKCVGDVTVRFGENITFLSDSSGSTLGLGDHVKHHGKYSYYPLKMDGFVFRIPKIILLKALRLVRAELDPKQDKVRLKYFHKDSNLVIVASDTKGDVESNPVTVVHQLDESGEVVGKSGLSDDFEVNANIDHLINLINDVRVHDVEFRAAVVNKGDRNYVLFRTIERYFLNFEGKVVTSEEDIKGEVYSCEVTRFMPSKD